MLAQAIDPGSDLLRQGPLVALVISFLYLFLSGKVVTRKELESAIERERERADEWKELAKGGTSVAKKAATSLEGLTGLLEQRIEEAVAQEVATLKDTPKRRQSDE